LDGLLEKMRVAGIDAVTREEAGYPELLKAIPDAPPTLFVRGVATFDDAYPLAIVGSRHCTAYGLRIARRIARDFATVGGTVVSGLAYGIDGAAHMGSVDAKARTIAVLGNGLDRIYPKDNEALADEILACGGSLVSELPLGSAPKGQHFPQRNRIISGMSKGLLLVEAEKQSGTMSTVTHALEQGREVFAIPGQADSPLSVFPHALIRDGARLVTSAAEIIEDLGWGLMPDHSGLGGTAPKMTEVERRLYALLLGGPADTDALMGAMGMNAAQMNSLLTIMELQGIIRKLPGRKVERVQRNMD
jgi:DNA processing protein